MRHTVIRYLQNYSWLAMAVLGTNLLAAPLQGLAETTSDHITLLDDTQTKIELKKTPERIISLAPHLTELLFSVNAGDKIVATVDYANYPEQAKKLPSLGNFTKLNAESIIAYKPDLVLAWQSGNDPRVIAQLRQLNVPVYVQDGEDMDLLPREVRQLGILTGNQATAIPLADVTEKQLNEVKQAQLSKPLVKVFYQVWSSPLMSVNDKQQIGKMIKLCGGQNIFGDSPVLAPQVSVESVLAANPDVIIASGMDKSRPEWLDDWKKWPQLTAVKNNALFFIEPDQVQRFTLRSVQGFAAVCGFLDQARAAQASR